MTEQQLDQLGPLIFLFGSVGVLIGIVAITWVAGRVFETASVGPPALTVVLLLSFLTALAIIGYIVTRRSELVTLAATGIGALAGAVTALYVQHQNGGDDNDER